MKDRIVTSLILGVLTLTALLLGGVWLYAIVIICISIGAYEYIKLINFKGKQAIFAILCATQILMLFVDLSVFALFYALVFIMMFFVTIIDKDLNFNDITFVFTMFVFVSFSGKALIELNKIDYLLPIYCCFANFSTDIFAFFGGKFFGKHKL
ncbi:MAG: phosphatidate cytidylyltransferase, partial [Erysipelotrichaceae bacterium]